jgi:hypothetical protein
VHREIRRVAGQRLARPIEFAYPHFQIDAICSLVQVGEVAGIVVDGANLGASLQNSCKVRK